MTDNFYEFFEGVNYASEDQVREYRSIYISYVKPILDFVESPLAFDFGCGRGEWLDMLRELGFRTKGFDIDQGMLNSAQQKGLDVQLGDASEFLKQIPDQSIAVLSAFHVLEHLPFDKIIEFFQQSKRVLIPGGVLIAETPNPENLFVITSNFYLDHTHIRPIPILQMINLARYFGYQKYSIIRLQEEKNLYHKEDITFRDLFYGVSKDYGLIAQNPGGAEGLIQAVDHPLRYETGIGIDDLIKRLDNRMENLAQKVRELSAKIDSEPEDTSQSN